MRSKQVKKNKLKTNVDKKIQKKSLYSNFKIVQNF